MSESSGSASDVRALPQTGYPGEIFLIHPRHEEVEGLKCHSNLGALAEMLDVALVISPCTTGPGIIEDCGTLFNQRKTGKHFFKPDWNTAVSRLAR